MNKYNAGYDSEEEKQVQTLKPQQEQVWQELKRRLKEILDARVQLHPQRCKYEKGKHCMNIKFDEPTLFCLAENRANGVYKTLILHPQASAESRLSWYSFISFPKDNSAELAEKFSQFNAALFDVCKVAKVSGRADNGIASCAMTDTNLFGAVCTPPKSPGIRFCGDREYVEGQLCLPQPAASPDSIVYLFRVPVGPRDITGARTLESLWDNRKSSAAWQEQVFENWAACLHGYAKCIVDRVHVGNKIFLSLDLLLPMNCLVTKKNEVYLRGLGSYTYDHKAEERREEVLKRTTRDESPEKTIVLLEVGFILTSMLQKWTEGEQAPPWLSGDALEKLRAHICSKIGRFPRSQAARDAVEKFGKNVRTQSSKISWLAKEAVVLQLKLWSSADEAKRYSDDEARRYSRLLVQCAICQKSSTHRAHGSGFPRHQALAAPDLWGGLLKVAENPVAKASLFTSNTNDTKALLVSLQASSFSAGFYKWGYLLYKQCLSQAKALLDKSIGSCYRSAAYVDEQAALRRGKEDSTIGRRLHYTFRALQSSTDAQRRLADLYGHAMHGHTDVVLLVHELLAGSITLRERFTALQKDIRVLQDAIQAKQDHIQALQDDIRDLWDASQALQELSTREKELSTLEGDLRTLTNIRVKLWNCVGTSLESYICMLPWESKAQQEGGSDLLFLQWSLNSFVVVNGDDNNVRINDGVMYGTGVADFRYRLTWTYFKQQPRKGIASAALFVTLRLAMLYAFEREEGGCVHSVQSTCLNRCAQEYLENVGEELTCWHKSALKRLANLLAKKLYDTTVFWQQVQLLCSEKCFSDSNPDYWPELKHFVGMVVRAGGLAFVLGRPVRAENATKPPVSVGDSPPGTKRARA